MASRIIVTEILVFRSADFFSSVQRRRKRVELVWNDRFPLVPRLCLGTHCRAGSACRIIRTLSRRHKLIFEAEPRSQCGFRQSLGTEDHHASSLALRVGVPRRKPDARDNLIQACFARFEDDVLDSLAHEDQFDSIGEPFDELLDGFAA